MSASLAEIKKKVSDAERELNLANAVLADAEKALQNHPFAKLQESFEAAKDVFGVAKARVQAATEAHKAAMAEREAEAKPTASAKS
jgi:hypothetical protein